MPVANPPDLSNQGNPLTAPPQTSISGSSDFSVAVLQALTLPVTQSNVQALNAWQAAEGQWTAGGQWNAAVNHNPLNLEGTTRGFPDTASSTHNANATNPINIYPDWSTGVTATAQRIQANPGIVAALRASAGTAALSRAVQASGWGTGNFAGGSGVNQGSSGANAVLTAAGGPGGAAAGGAEHCVVGPVSLGSLPIIGQVGPSWCVLGSATARGLLGALLIPPAVGLTVAGLILVAKASSGVTGAIGAGVGAIGAVGGPPAALATGIYASASRRSEDRRIERAARTNTRAASRTSVSASELDDRRGEDVF